MADETLLAWDLGQDEAIRMANSLFPEIVLEKDISFCFGLARLMYWVEDRKTTTKQDRYKNFVWIRVLWKQWRWSYRTNYLYDYLPCFEPKAKFPSSVGALSGVEDPSLKREA